MQPLREGGATTEEDFKMEIPELQLSNGKELAGKNILGRQSSKDKDS